MNKEVEDALEILNGLLNNYNDFFVNESKIIPDDIKETYLNIANAFIKDLTEADLKKYSKLLNYDELQTKYQTLKTNLKEAEVKIKEHNERAENLKQEKLIKDIGQIQSDESIEKDIVTLNDEELALYAKNEDKLKYIKDKINFVIKEKNVKENEILILTYTNKDVKNYKTTLTEYPNINISPINKFISSLTNSNIASKPLNKVVDEELNKQLKDSNYLKNLVLYLLHYHQNALTSLKFKTREEYNGYLEALDLKTIKGEKLNTPELINVANFLTENKINYQIKTVIDENSNYDILSLDNNIDIIYFEIDEKGTPPEYINKDEYSALINKIRANYDNSNSKLIECYAYEKNNGSILNNIYSKLFAVGVKFIPEEPETLFEYLKKANPNLINALKETIQITIKAIIEENKEPKDFNKTLSERKLAELITPIYDKYDKNNDFAEITRKLANNLKISENYKFLIIDNFEEISTTKLNFVKKLKEVTNANLLILGDDWQSIYLNSGTNPKYIKNIKKYMSNIKITNIPAITNNIELANISKFIISKTPNYYNKKIEGTSRNGSVIGIIKINSLKDIKQKLENKIKDLPKEKTIALVGRYPEDNPHLTLPNIKFILMTDIKNVEFDYTFIINTKKGLCEMPNTLINNSILHEIIETEEPLYNEYRMLNVAIKNTNDKVYFIIDKENTSKIISSIINEFESDIISEETECPSCGSKLIIKPEGEGEILSCTNTECTYQRPLN
ncbi:MAG: hypothetical protein Q4C33_03760 [bacterium]|nr:hypothetical protein [bacterium]